MIKQSVKLLVAICSLWIFFSSAIIVKAEGEFWLDVDPSSKSIVTTAGSPNQIDLTLINRLNQKREILPYAFWWNKTSKDKLFTFSDWYSFESKKYPLTAKEAKKIVVTQQVPLSASVGDYYNVLAFSDQQYSCEQSDNPTLMVGFPINTMIVKDLGINLSNLNDQEFYAQSLYSDIKLVNWRQNYNWWIQREEFEITLRNDGNIAGIPYGNIRIMTNEGIERGRADLVEGTQILPGQSTTFLLTFDTSRLMLGGYSAKLDINSYDNLHHRLGLAKDTQSFVFVSRLAILYFGLLFLSLVLIYHFSGWMLRQIWGRRIPSRYLRYFVILITTVTAVTMITVSTQLFQNEDRLLGTIVTSNSQVGINAVVRELTGLRVRQVDGVTLVSIKTNSSKGWELWQFSCDSTRIIKTDRDFPDYVNTQQAEFILDKSAEKSPLLLIARRV